MNPKIIKNTNNQNHVFMKKPNTIFRTRILPILVLTMFLSMVGLKSMAQPLLVENFDYTIGTALTANGWTAHNGAGLSPIIVTNGLAFSGYLGSGIGGAANLAPSANSSEDVNKTFTSQTTGVVYAAFVIQTQSTNNAGYFLHFSTNPLNTSFQYTRIWVNATGDGIGIGANAPASYVTISAGTPTLVVIKYDLTSKVSSLYRFSSFPSSEPVSADATFTETTAIISTGCIALRQYNSAQRVIVDGIRVATTWADAVTPSGTVTPTVTVSPSSMSGFNYAFGSGPSTDQPFAVSGTDLTGNIFLAASTNYEISLTSGSGYTTSIELTQTAGTLAATTIFVRLKAGLAAGTYNGEIINITSAGASAKTVTCSGSVTALTPQLAVDSVALTGFTYGVGSGPSASNYYTLSGTYLTDFPGTILVSGSLDYEVSNDDVTWGPNTTVGFASATLDPVPVFVRLIAGLPLGSYNSELIVNSGGGAVSVNVTCSGTVTPPLPTAQCLLRPSHIDLSSPTSQSAVMMKLQNYASDLVRYKIFSSSTQYYCWDESLDIYQTSSTTGDGPLAPGTPTTSSTFWILFQRGNNINGDASYRDRIPPFSADYKTIVLPPASSITTPFSLSGNFVPFGGYDNTVKHVVLAYSSSVLVSATSTTLSTGAFTLVCPDGTTIDLIEVRAIDNTLIASRTGSWSVTSVVGNIPDLPVVAAPVITPATGNFYAPFSATITCTTPASSIYYTTDGSDPDNAGNGTLYTIPVPISATTTLKAKAYATNFDPSIVVSVVYNFPVINDVANIAALRAGLTNGTAYRLTGEAVLTFKSITRNAKYIQDATGAIIIDDVTGKITTTYNVYDGITGITGTLSLNNLMLQFVPVMDPGAATSTGNTVVPEVVSLNNLNTTHQAKLVKVLYTTITGTGNFGAVINYPLTDPSGTGVMRTHYADVDYINTPIPAAPQNLTGVILQFGSTMQLIPRALADFEVSAEASLTATPNTLSGFLYAAGNGPSTSQSYVLEGSNLTGYPGNITVSATGTTGYEVSTDDVNFSPSVNVPFTSSVLAPATIHVRLKAGLVSGAYNGEVIVNSGGGILLPLNVTCSGTVLAGEPTNHASGFTAVSPVSSAITLTWSDNDGIQPADRFLVLANTTGTFAVPVDGVEQINDSNLGDGSGIMNVAHGVQTLSWGGLLPGTQYYFVIYPYTNAGILIDYKTTPAAPTATATTLPAALPLAAWTFDLADFPVPPNTPTSVASNYGSQPTAMLYANGTNGSSLWLNPTSNPELSSFGGTTLNDPRPTPIANNAIALANNSANGKSIVLKFSMSGYENPILTFATRGTSTGFNTHQWAWSTDNVSYTNFGTNTVNNTSTFLLRTLDLGAIDALDQAVEVYIRLTVSGATSATGNNRLDNIVLDATPAAPLTKTLNLTELRLEHLFLEGNVGIMKQAYNANGPQYGIGIADLVTVELHDVANYGTILHTATVNLSITGQANITDIPSSLNGSYRITIKHRNSIETTSALPVDFSSSAISYSFGSLSSAYGNNMKLLEGYYWIYGGDVNQDGQVEQLDVTDIENGVNAFLNGYLSTDADGSGDLGITDYTIWENNNNIFVSKKTP